MIALLIASLIAAAIYLAKALKNAQAENAVLRDQVASLKRQLRRGRA